MDPLPISWKNPNLEAPPMTTDNKTAALADRLFAEAENTGLHPDVRDLLAEACAALTPPADGVAWDEGSPCVEPRPVGMVYPTKPAPRASGYLDDSGVEWNAYDTGQMEAYARAAYVLGYAAQQDAATPADGACNCASGRGAEHCVVHAPADQPAADRNDDVHAAQVARADRAAIDQLRQQLAAADERRLILKGSHDRLAQQLAAMKDERDRAVSAAVAQVKLCNRYLDPQHYGDLIADNDKFIAALATPEPQS